MDGEHRRSRFRKGASEKQEKICLSSHAVVAAAEMVLREERAGRAEAADLFHILGTGRSTGAEKLFGLVPVQIVPFIVLADGAVFPAGLPVLFRILYNRRFP
jgi:hypothetical protein